MCVPCCLLCPAYQIASRFLFNLCASEREDLTLQIRDSNDQQLQNDLTKLRSSIITRMEAKGEQIVKLKHCQDLVTVCSYAELKITKIYLY